MATSAHFLYCDKPSRISSPSGILNSACWNLGNFSTRTSTLPGQFQTTCSNTRADCRTRGRFSLLKDCPQSNLRFPTRSGETNPALAGVAKSTRSAARHNANAAERVNEQRRSQVGPAAPTSRLGQRCMRGQGTGGVKARNPGGMRPIVTPRPEWRYAEISLSGSRRSERTLDDTDSHPHYR